MVVYLPAGDKHVSSNSGNEKVSKIYDDDR